MVLKRHDGRTRHELRKLSCQIDFQGAPDGSVFLKWGNTHILCAVTINDGVPPHRAVGGWLTAEYNMLPGSGKGRVGRSRGKVKGRTAEIQRLIGRCLRSTVDLEGLPPITVTVDCDVINADGGTRCASITAGYIATVIAFERYVKKHSVEIVIPAPIAAVSVELLEDEPLTDLCYLEDSQAHVDMNIVSSEQGIVEIQGTGEAGPFSRTQFDAMLNAGLAACDELHSFQREVLAQWRNHQTD